MPTISVSGPAMSVEVKRKLAEELTAAASEAYGMPAEAIVVVIQENAPENVAIGGKLIADRRARRG